MYIHTSVRPLTPEELELRRLALRDAVICLGWIKFLSICYYIFLLMLVKGYSEGFCSNLMTLMILTVIPVQTINAVLLFLGAIEVRVIALQMAAWLCVAVATHNTFLGLLGAIYFIRYGYELLHFVLVMFFLLLPLSICSVLCHDVIVIYAYIKLSENPSASSPPGPERLMITYTSNQTQTQSEV